MRKGVLTLNDYVCDCANWKKATVLSSRKSAILHMNKGKPRKISGNPACGSRSPVGTKQCWPPNSDYSCKGDSIYPKLHLAEKTTQKCPQVRTQKCVVYELARNFKKMHSKSWHTTNLKCVNIQQKRTAEIGC
jgi:hypothetical protein